MLPIEEKTETIPAALEIDWMSGTASRPTVALSDQPDQVFVDAGRHIMYTHDRSTVAFRVSVSLHREPNRVRFSYDEEEVLVLFDDLKGVLVPNILYSGKSSVVLAYSLYMF